jgi:hypothetical protein
MGGSLILQNRLLPLESVSLARFVTDKTSPQRHYHVPFTNAPTDYTTVLQHNILEIGFDNQNSSHGGQFTELLNLYRSNGEGKRTGVSAISSALYELKQWDTIFKKACGMEETRRWVEDCIESGKPIYFIVGFRTFFNPSIAELSTSRSSIVGEVRLPILAVAAANAPGIQLGNVLDPGVSREVGKQKGLWRRSESEGEMVYAVQYCRVGFRWFNSRKVEKASLGDGKWKISWGVRSKEEIEEDDVIEALLEEGFGEDEEA